MPLFDYNEASSFQKLHAGDTFQALPGYTYEVDETESPYERFEEKALAPGATIVVGGYDSQWEVFCQFLQSHGAWDAFITNCNSPAQLDGMNVKLGMPVDFIMLAFRWEETQSRSYWENLHNLWIRTL